MNEENFSFIIRFFDCRFETTEGSGKKHKYMIFYPIDFIIVSLNYIREWKNYSNFIDHRTVESCFDY